MLLAIAACAGSIAPPRTVQQIPQGRKVVLRSVVAEAGPAEAMTPADLDRNVQQVLADIRAIAPRSLLLNGGPQTQVMKIVFTRYEAGSAFARFMLAGLGQIRIDADVLLADPGTRLVMGKVSGAKGFLLRRDL